MKKGRKNRPRSASANAGGKGVSKADRDTAKPENTAFSGRGAGRYPWAVAIAVIIGLSVVFSECLLVYRNAISPARQKSSSVKTAGDDVGEQIAGSAAEAHYFIDFDGYYWVTFARQMVSEGEIRVRRTDLDNAPFGRPVHWSSAFSWYLVSLGGVHSVVSGLPIRSAISSAAYYANPLLMAFLLVGVGWVSYRRMGNLGGSLLVLLLALQPALLRDFGYARPDHHGLHLICALGVVLLVILGGGGWIRPNGNDDEKQTNGGSAATKIDRFFALGLSDARRWFIASGILGGCGLWVGATQQAVVIGSVGVGGFIAMLGATRRTPACDDVDQEPDRRWAPELWRIWARVGALTSFLAYLIEYFPGHLGLRLEVNHPLYAISWLCAGEVLYCIGQSRLAGTPPREYPILKLGLLVGGVTLLPLLAFLGPTDWYVLKDPLMLRLHSLIGEFQPLLSEVHGWGLAREMAPMALVVLGIGFLRLRRTDGRIRSLLIIGLVPSLLLGVAFVAQVRWGGLFLVASCGIVLPLLLVAVPKGLRSTPSRVGALLLVLAVGFQLVPNADRVVSRVGALAGGGASLPLADEVFARDLALILDAASGHGPGPISVMTGLAEGSRIHAFGSARAAGSQYWENLDGVRDMVDFFGDYGEDEALRIARRRRIDYVVVATDLVSMAQMLKYGNNNPKGVENTLAYRLFKGDRDVPAWCRPVRVKGFRWANHCRIYKVTGIGDGES